MSKCASLGCNKPDKYAIESDGFYLKDDVLNKDGDHTGRTDTYANLNLKDGSLRNNRTIYSTEHNLNVSVSSADFCKDCKNLAQRELKDLGSIHIIAGYTG